MQLINFRNKTKKTKSSKEIWTKESEDNNKVFATSNRVQYMLRNGYQLNIGTNKQKSECTAFTSLKYGDTPLNEAEELDINCLLSDISFIRQYLLQNYGTTIIIVFSGSNNKFEGWAVKELTEGPYCEHDKYEVIEKTKVESYSFNDCIKKLEDKLSLIKQNISSCNNLKLYYNKKELKKSETMEQVKEEIPFNYFLLMFEKEVYHRTMKIRFLKREDEDDLYVLSKEEQIQVFNDSFYNVLLNYLSLINNEEIVVLPKNPIDLSSLILNDLTEGPYQHSFLMSLQCIIQSYLDVLGKGYPTLGSKERENEEKSFSVIYDRSQRINTFDSTNMSLEEQDDIMIKVLKNTINNKIELMSSVRYISRTDI